jgi:hypothetical protein
MQLRTIGVEIPFEVLSWVLSVPKIEKNLKWRVYKTQMENNSLLLITNTYFNLTEMEKMCVMQV